LLEIQRFLFEESRKIFTLSHEDLIYWVIKSKLLKKPNGCKLCRKKTGKRVFKKLISNRNYLNQCVWKCPYKGCRGVENIRNGNKLFENFPKMKLRILLIYIFTHFNAMMVSPSISQGCRISLSSH